MQILISKVFYFEAAHQLEDEQLPTAENFARYQECSRLHGHSYKLIVTLSGEKDRQTQMILNLKALNLIVEQKILDLVDHRNLNTDVPFMKGVVPTMENLAEKFFEVLRPEFFEQLVEIQIYETPTSFVTVKKGP